LISAKHGPKYIIQIKRRMLKDQIYDLTEIKQKTRCFASSNLYAGVFLWNFQHSDQIHRNYTHPMCFYTLYAYAVSQIKLPVVCSPIFRLKQGGEMNRCFEYLFIEGLRVENKQDGRQLTASASSLMSRLLCVTRKSYDTTMLPWANDVTVTTNVTSGLLPRGVCLYVSRICEKTKRIVSFLANTDVGNIACFMAGMMKSMLMQSHDILSRLLISFKCH